MTRNPAAITDGIMKIDGIMAQLLSKKRGNSDSSFVTDNRSSPKPDRTDWNQTAPTSAMTDTADGDGPTADRPLPPWKALPERKPPDRAKSASKEEQIQRTFKSESISKREEMASADAHFPNRSRCRSLRGWPPQRESTPIESPRAHSVRLFDDKHHQTVHPISNEPKSSNLRQSHSIETSTQIVC